MISIVACCHSAELCAHAARVSDRNKQAGGKNPSTLAALAAEPRNSLADAKQGLLITIQIRYHNASLDLFSISSKQSSFL